MTKRWTIAGRTSRWFIGTTAALVITVSLVSVFAVERAIERELAAFSEEELVEMAAYFSVSDRSPDKFGELVHELSRRHPEAPMAWRVWEDGTGQIWGEFGDLTLFEGHEIDPKSKGVTKYGDLRWQSQRLVEGLTVGFLFDGSGSLRTARLFTFAIFGFAGLSILIASATGYWLGRHLSTQMRQIVADTRSVKNIEEIADFHFDEAPDEIRQVGLAMQQMLSNIRIEIDKANLIASGLAHELRSPIQNMMGEADVALLREREPEEYRRVLESQREELRELGRVVDNLVLLVASEESHRAPERESFDLAGELQKRMGRERILADKKGVEIDLRATGEFPIHGDREAILLCLRNLIANAVDWSPAYEKVEVTMRRTGDRVEVVIQDHGPGIPPGERNRIFQPFYQMPPRNGDRAGYGLGLAIARSAAEAHGGSIVVSDADGGGARFTVELPLALDAREPQSSM